jgi:ubiquinone/menaquinone biosynthesis C-methylase UbiE
MAAGASHPLFARYMARAARISDRKGAVAHRQRLLAGLSGRVAEVGAGSGIHFGHYPPSVREVIAIEPEPSLRAMAERAAREAPVPVRVVDGVAEALPLADGAVDAGVCAGVLCSVEDPDAVLAELARVIGPGGELRFLEHVASRRPRAAWMQRAVDRSGVWSRMMAGCQVARRTEETIARAGFVIEELEHFSFRPTPLDAPVTPRILGRARRP